MKVVRIGTRKSRLAMRQTSLVIEAYQKLLPDISFEIVPISTKGDELLHKSLTSFGGKGAFVTEIEKALMDGTIDLAVHSAKDLPFPVQKGLTIAATPRREDPRDVLVLKKENCTDYCEFDNWEEMREYLCSIRLKAVGTGSVRRQYQLERLIKAQSKEIRGNVTTRLSKLESGEYDAVMLAAAGLKRLCLDKEEAYQYFYMDPNYFLPAPCQGIIAVECREDDPFLKDYAVIEDKWTRKAFELERQVMEEAGGSCTDIVGALALPDETKHNGAVLHVLRNGEYKIVYK